MRIVESPPLTIIQPGGGRSGGLAPGIGVVFKLNGEDTGGAVSIVEHPLTDRISGMPVIAVSVVKSIPPTASTARRS